MSNWFTRLFSASQSSNSRDTHGCYTPPANSLPPPAPVSLAPTPQPGLSCFVKGLIKSMETEPEKWHEIMTSWTHKLFQRVWVSMPNEGDDESPESGHAEVYGVRLTEAEEIALYTAVRKLGALKAAAQIARENERIAAMKAPFETLGCPETPKREGGTEL